jgi:TetR/AcrR family transcriptional repressor of cmeABC operon
VDISTDKKRTDKSRPQGRRQSKTANKSRRVRHNGPDRRTQIATATLRLMARYGIHGTTVSRIAEEVGMEAPSLYAHFPSRQDMLLAAFEIMRDRVVNHLISPSEPNMLERLRTIGESHAALITKAFDDFVLPTFAVLTAPRDSGLAQLAGQRQLETLKALAGFVEEGKRQGTIRQDMDSRMAAYEMMLLFWAEDVTQLMGLDELVADGISHRILDLFLRDMAASPEPIDAEASEGVDSPMALSAPPRGSGRA